MSDFDQLMCKELEKLTPAPTASKNYFLRLHNRLSSMANLDGNAFANYLDNCLNDLSVSSLEKELIEYYIDTALYDRDDRDPSDLERLGWIIYHSTYFLKDTRLGQIMIIRAYTMLAQGYTADDIRRELAAMLPYDWTH